MKISVGEDNDTEKFIGGEKKFLNVGLIEKERNLFRMIKSIRTLAR